VRPSGQRTVLIRFESTILAAVKHRETYLALLSPTLRDRLLATLKEEGILTLLKAHALEVVDAIPIPYVRLEITAGENGLVAHCTGVWFDARPLLGPEVEQDYYLPVLGVSQGRRGSELVTMHLADYVAILERRYIKMFPGSAATIRNAVRRSVNHHGREVFGARADERIQMVNALTSLKILAQFLQNNARREATHAVVPDTVPADRRRPPASPGDLRRDLGREHVGRENLRRLGEQLGGALHQSRCDRALEVAPTRGLVGEGVHDVEHGGRDAKNEPDRGGGLGLGELEGSREEAGDLLLLAGLGDDAGDE